MLPQWDRFVVVTTLGHVPRQVGYSPQHFFPAETCARHVYVGVEDYISEVPPNLLQLRKGTEIHKGVSAYAWFMEFYCGLKAHHEFDIHVVRQVHDAWNAYREKHSEEKILIPYMETIFRDGALVREHLPAEYTRRPTVENVAVDMAELGWGKTALVIGGASTITHNVVASLGHKKTCNPSAIILTHPESGESNKLVHELRRLPSHRKLEIDLSVKPFETALDLIASDADAVFVCQPMARADDHSSLLARVNDDLCDAWKVRCLQSGAIGKLIHLKGSPEDRGATAGPWLELGRDHGFVPLVSIQEERNRKIADLRRITAHTSEVIMQMGRARAAAQRIRDFTFDSSTMTFNFEAAMGPRIRNPEAFQKAQTERARSERIRNALTL